MTLIRSLYLSTTIFNMAYLAIIWAMTVLMGWRYLHHSPAQRRVSRWLLYAVLVLGAGDLFHLVARAFRTLTGVESVAGVWGELEFRHLLSRQEI